MSTVDDHDLEDSLKDDEIVDVVELEPLSKRTVYNRNSSDDDEDRSFIKAFARQPDENAFDGSQTEPEHELEVHLPEELRGVLYISSSQNSEVKEHAIAESILKGEPSHPGQSIVWGAGEVTRPKWVDSDDEEDWEGEGTPWEVGEM